MGYSPQVNVSATKPVRFSTLVESGGKPTVYLPLGDPAKDRVFMKAVKERRVLTIKQEPTSTHKDFGVVGFLKEKFVTYLVFPKSLQRFSNQRVVGIKYDVIGEAEATAAGSAPSPRTARPRREKPKPQPKEFVVQVRVTARTDKRITVRAMNQRAAKADAEQQARTLPDQQDANVSTRVVSVRESK